MATPSDLALSDAFWDTPSPVAVAVAPATATPVLPTPSQPSPVRPSDRALGTATLEGDFSRPALRIRFDKGARHPKSGTPMLEWVRQLPGRAFDRSDLSWLITGTGGLPSTVMAAAGFAITTDVHSAEGLQNLTADELFPPLIKASVTNPGICLVRHRFAGYEHTQTALGPAAAWDKASGRFEIATSEVIRDGKPLPGFLYMPGTLETAASLLQSASKAIAAPEGVSGRSISSVASSDGKTDLGSLTELEAAIGGIPNWFGLDLYPFQRFGALAAAAGHSLLADEPGLGKSRQSLAAVAVRHQGRTDGQDLRLILVCPPVVVTHWEREVTKSNLHRYADSRRGTSALAGNSSFGADGGYLAPLEVIPETKEVGPGNVAEATSAPPIENNSQFPGTPIVPKKKTKRDAKLPARGKSSHESPTVGEVVVFRAGRKEPKLPARGIIIVPDSLLAARPQLLAEFINWNPTAFIYDEVHRAKTWTSRRATATRTLAEATRGLRVAISGTPLFATPYELASPLAITGHLVPVFGGFTPFVTRFCKQNHFKVWVPIAKMLPELQERMQHHVWVRRAKSEVLTDLPKKSRVAEVVDVDLTGFRQAHKDVAEKIKEWALDFKDTNGFFPNEATIKAWAQDQIGLISPLRKAAGLAKVPVAVDLIAEWVDDTTQWDGERPVFTRPLVVWGHHTVVVEALANAVPDQLQYAVAIIDGGTSSQERQRLADEFQAGNLGVLVCSISAAGVGITLTRSADALFVETDWTPALIAQAEDRIHRISQVKPVTITTMIAPGTLDEHIQKVLARKSKILDAVMGNGDNAVAVAASESSAGPAQIVCDMAVNVIDKLRGKK